ncbi:hypothetical protein [Actinomyces sp. 217892]|nr:hypothetical protein [Actinomyces sp. 217892]
MPAPILLLLLVPALAGAVASCAHDDVLVQPSPLPPAATRAEAVVSVSGIQLPLPADWAAAPTTDDGEAWALRAGEQDSAHVLVSTPLGAGSGGQARMLATTLLGAAVSGYTETGSYTSGAPGPAVAAGQADEGVIHLAFTRTGHEGSSRAWVLATTDGWVVIALVGADDALALAYEQALVAPEDAPADQDAQP